MSAVWNQFAFEKDDVVQNQVLYLSVSSFFPSRLILDISRGGCKILSILLSLILSSTLITLDINHRFQ